MTDPIDQIRERVQVVLMFKGRDDKRANATAEQVKAYIDFLQSAPEDMQLLLDRVEELEKRVRMYEVVKS